MGSFFSKSVNVTIGNLIFVAVIGGLLIKFITVTLKYIYKFVHERVPIIFNKIKRNIGYRVRFSRDILTESDYAIIALNIYNNKASDKEKEAFKRYRKEKWDNLTYEEKEKYKSFGVTKDKFLKQ